MQCMGYYVCSSINLYSSVGNSCLNMKYFLILICIAHKCVCVCVCVLLILCVYLGDIGLYCNYKLHCISWVSMLVLYIDGLTDSPLSQILGDGCMSERKKLNV